jgi:putative transposase
MVLQDRFRVSQRRACRLACQHRNIQRRPVPLAAIEEQKLRLAYRRLRLDSCIVHHKRVQRISREEGFQRPLPRRRKRLRPADGLKGAAES